MSNRSLFKIFSVSTIWVWLLIFALLPIILLFGASLLTPGSSQLFYLHITLINYQQILSKTYFKVFLNSFTLATISTLLCLLIGYPFTYFIARSQSRYKPIWLLLVIIPFWTSSLIRTYAILALIKTKGIINTLLLKIGLIHHPLHILYSYEAVIIGTVYTLLPFMILPLYASIEKLDYRLIDAARDLGASSFRRFMRITLPLTMPGIIAGIILVFLPAMTLFYIPVLLGGAKDLLLGNLIQNEFLIANNWPLGSAVSILLIVAVSLMLLVHMRVARAKGQEGFG